MVGPARHSSMFSSLGRLSSTHPFKDESGVRIASGLPRRPSVASSALVDRGYLGDDRADLLLELRKVLLDGRPYALDVDPEVAVREDVPHSDHLSPSDVRSSSPEILGDAARRLADDLEVMDDPHLHELLTGESPSPAADMA